MSLALCVGLYETLLKVGFVDCGIAGRAGYQWLQFLSGLHLAAGQALLPAARVWSDSEKACRGVGKRAALLVPCAQAGFFPKHWPHLSLALSTAWNLTGFALALLLAFRTNMAYDRWGWPAVHTCAAQGHAGSSPMFSWYG